MEAAIADTVAGVGKAKNIYNKEDNPKAIFFSSQK